WKNICGNYPENEISRVIREDPKNPGFLFVGSETGIFFSHNDGANWNRLGGNFPVVPVYDLKIKDDEMVVATHGRSFWILDDLNPIRESSRFKAEDDFHFFPPKSTFRRTLNWSTNLFMGDGKNYSPAFGIPGTSYVSEDKNGEKQTRYLDLGENPPQGVIFHYVLNDPENSKLELQIFDSKGNLIDTFETKQEDKVSGQTENDDEEDQKPALTSSKGLNRFVWNMRYPGPSEKIDKTLEQKRYKALGRGEMGERGGPTAMPGTYQAVLRIENTKQEHHFEILKDPRLETSEEDYQAQFDLWMNIRDQLSETNRLLNQLRRIRREIHVILERPNLQNGKVPDELSSFKDNAEKVIQKLEVLENELFQTKNETPSDRLRFPVMLRDRIEGLISVVAV
ncbi:MAG: glycosyl hydrolase, partial [SAR324 cluster bacterium]|nr:glycosyl hydrolase [SAR324 cluster bacterium]